MVCWHLYDASTAGMLDRSGRLKAPDFLQFYTYATLVDRGQGDRLYRDEAHAAIAMETVDPRMRIGGFKPNYSPVIAWAVSPLAQLPYPQAMAAFSLAMSAVYLAATALLVHRAGLVRRDWVTVALAAAAWPTFVIVLRYGQIAPLSLAIVVCSSVAASRGRMALAGFALGLLAYKPNLLLAPALLALLSRHWRVLAGLAAGAVIETAVNLALVGPEVFSQYVAILLDLVRQPALVQIFPAESHSIRGLVALLVPWPPLVQAVTALAVPVAAGLGAMVWRRHQDWRARWAALVLASMLASPHLLTYDLLLLAVPMVLVADWNLERGWPSDNRWTWSLAALYFGAWPGVFIARLFHVQASTLAMVLLLWLLARAPRADPA